jgi:enoyl-CoA hydratase
VAIDLEVRDHIAVITINEPERLNSLNTELLQALLGRIEEANSTSGVRVIVLTGAGERAFVAGADIKEMVALDAAGGKSFGELGHAVTGALARSPQPVIAAVNGFALGGGCELALACDIRLASENAVFAQPEVSLGIPPGWGGSQRLPRIVGPGMASELIFTGRRVKADEALRIGLVNAVLPADELMPRALEMAGSIAANGPLCVRDSKRLIARSFEGDVDGGLAAEAAAFAEAFTTDDQDEGMTAFVEKRAAQFSDEVPA